MSMIPYEGKTVISGLESSGKSLMLSIYANEVLQRNLRWIHKRELQGLPFVQRTMAFDSPMSKDFIQQIESAGMRYIQFKNLVDILYLQQADIFINEVIKYFPASGSASLSQEQLHFCTQGAKSGVNIYATSQDFSQVHKQFRLLVNEVHVVSKIIGSRRPMKTSPPVKRIWGIGWIRDVAPMSFKGDSATMESSGMGRPYLIRRVDCERYDTSYKVPQSKLPVKKLRRQEMECDEDGYKKTIYV